MNRKSRSLFVVASGPRHGKPALEAAFPDAALALRYAEELHGLTAEELRRLKRDRCLDLDPARHGAARCALTEEAMTPERARRALSGELYLPSETVTVEPVVRKAVRRAARLLPN